MNNSIKKIIDSHVHLDMIYKYNHKNLHYYKKKNLIAISWSFSKNIKNINNLKKYLKLQWSKIKEIEKKTNINCYYMSGIHPRNIINGLKISDISDILLTNLNNPKCLGLGEIGLETGNKTEINMLRLQLDLLNSHKNDKLKIGIHTPKKNKYEITYKTIRILNKYKHFRNRIIIDHCNMETLPIVIDNGYMAGLTLGPPKVELKELLKIIDKYENKLLKLVCNSDNGANFSSYFFDFIDYEKKLNYNIKNKLIFESAHNFFNI